MQNRHALAPLLTAMSVLLIACGGGGSSSADTTSASTSSYVPVNERPDEAGPEIALPAQLDAVVKRLDQEGFETTARRPVGVLGNVQVEGGVTLTLWPDEARRDRYVKSLEQIRAERAPQEVLFEVRGLIVVWLDRDGEPSSEERAAFDATVAAVEAES